jgi:hypothetical protein
MIFPVQGLIAAYEQRRFLCAVEGKFQRLPVHDALSSNLKQILNNALSTPVRMMQHNAKIEQIRLEGEPDLLNPTWVRIHFVCHKRLGSIDEKLFY